MSAGLVSETHAARYRELGAWIMSCYGTPLAQLASYAAPKAVGGVYTFTLPEVSGTIDRAVLREDQSQGQRIRTWTLEEIPALDGAAPPQLLGNGTSIGNRKVVLFKAPVTVAGLKLTVTTAGVVPALKLFGVYKPCPSQ